MAVYQDDLPAIHLAGDELMELENSIKRNTTNVTYTIAIQKDGFKYKLSSFEELIEDINLPDKTTDFTIKLSCDAGDIRLYSNNFSSSGVRISGDTEWVISKKREIKNQIKKNRNILRTHFSKLVFGVYGIQWFWVFILRFMEGTDTTPEYNFVEAVFGVVFLILFFSWPLILFKGMNYIYPKHLLKRDESVHYRPRLQKSLRVGILLLTIIGGIGGLVSLLSNL